MKSVYSTEVVSIAIYTAKVGYIVTRLQNDFFFFFNCGNVLSSWDLYNSREAYNLLGVTDSRFSKLYVHVMNLRTTRHNDGSYWCQNPPVMGACLVLSGLIFSFSWLPAEVL